MEMVLPKLCNAFIVLVIFSFTSVSIASRDIEEQQIYIESDIKNGNIALTPRNSQDSVENQLQVTEETIDIPSQEILSITHEASLKSSVPDDDSTGSLLDDSSKDLVSDSSLQHTLPHASLQVPVKDSEQDVSILKQNAVLDEEYVSVHDEYELEEYYEGSSDVEVNSLSSSSIFENFRPNIWYRALYPYIVSKGKGKTRVKQKADSRLLSVKMNRTATGANSTVDDGHGLRKRVPLRTILLSLKPPSLMDDEEREAAALNKEVSTSPSAAENTLGHPGTVNNVSVTLSAVDGSVTTNSTNSPDASVGQKTEGADGASNQRTGVGRKAFCVDTASSNELQILNSTALQALVSPNANMSSRGMQGPCVLVLFFSPYCQFSTAISLQATATARALKDFIAMYAVDAVLHHSIITQYGVVGTPHLVLFHNGYLVSSYNESSLNESGVRKFILQYTRYTEDDLKDLHIEVLPSDIENCTLPLKTLPRSGIWLAGAWLVLAAAAGRWFLKSSLCERLVETVLASWREAEQHQHQD